MNIPIDYLGYSETHRLAMDGFPGGFLHLRKNFDFGLATLCLLSAEIT